MPDLPTLNYATPPPLHHRRSFRRWVYVTVLLGVAVSGWWWIPAAWRRVELLYWQHRCMVYTPPPAQKIFDSKTGLIVTPPEWLKFYKMLSPPGFYSSGTAFLHELRNHRGQPRLVAVDIFIGPAYFAANYHVFDPGTLMQGARDVSPLDFAALDLGDSDRLQVMAGVIDPADPTHFSITCIEGGVTHLYDGWLQNDNTILFGERKSPATQAAPDVHPGLQNAK